MKFCVSWLKDYLDFNASNEELASKLTEIGLEVESIDDVAKTYQDFRVALVLDVIKHENSDKLSICKVQNHGGEILQIVCGAKNVRPGLKVALAPIGSIIPSNQMVIKKAKVAGIESHGMICSAEELLLGVDGDGIIEIDDEYDIGALISDIYGLNDAVIEINVTPNRGDCLGIYGIARDLAAANFGILRALPDIQVNPNFFSEMEVKLLANYACDYALFRRIKGVKNCESPEWLRNRLDKIGVNSISTIVDVTNYVMYCLNRPMHAYDATKVSGAINIDYAKNGEKFLSLNDQEYILDENILTIRDDNKVLAVAGVIGSKDSGCEFETNDIILESAAFTKDAVAQSGRGLNILSDSRYRFERGVDYKTCLLGIEMATALILEVCGGSVSDIKEVRSKYFDENPRVIDFDLEKVEKLIGIQVSKQKSIEILQKLGFKVQENGGNNIKVQIPSFRSDIDGEADLIEEIVRVYGYDKIPTQKIDLGYNKPKNNVFDAIRLNLVNKGMVENINWSFCDSKISKDFTDLKDELFIANPIAENLDYMRPNLIIGLLNSYKKNYVRGLQNGGFFEIGRVFSGVEENVQNNMIGGILAGRNKEQNHYLDDRDFDIFDAKKCVFDILSLIGINPENLILDEGNVYKFCHPYRFAEVKLGKNVVGYFAQLHPMITKKFDIKKDIYIFEIFSDNLAKKLLENFGVVNKKSFEFNDLQSVYRDYAFVIDGDKKIGDLVKIIGNCDKKLIKQVDIFDIYQGDKIEDGKKSVALRVQIQPIEKSLTGEEIDVISDKIIGEVAKFGGVIR